MKLPMLPRDKANHFAYGSAAAIVALFVFGSPVMALAGAALAGAVGEGADYVANRREPGSHEVSPLDWLATFAGGVLVYAAAVAHGLPALMPYP